ncbi:serine protease filzig [Culicoides brevitarsis]|uniref:serine protease filzig n=1 Tax=Culicoides brevitarsis TaxID=469753 RepID=UPI00307B3B3C
MKRVILNSLSSTILVVLVVCCCVLDITVVGLSSTRERENRKFFGGYRIAPKFCNATRLQPGTSKPRGPTICMFNHECSQRNGEVVGACMDGFLFGTCCLLKGQEHNGHEMDDDYIEEMPQSNLAAVSSYERYGSAQGDSYLDKKKYQNEYDFQMDPDMVEKYEKLNEATGYFYSTTSIPESEAHTTTINSIVGRQTTTEAPSYQEETVAPTTNVYLPNISSHKYSEELPSALLNKFSNQETINPISSVEITSSTTNGIDDIFTSSNVHYIGNVLRENVDSTTNREFNDITYEDDSYDTETSNYPTTTFYRKSTSTTEKPQHNTRVTYPKPQFRPKPTKESTNNYILVQTVSNERYNDSKTAVSEPNLESIESIILMLNDTNPGPSYDTDISTERIAPDSTEMGYYSTYSDEYDTTQYSTNRYRPVTRKPASRPSFYTTTFQPDSYQEETEMYSSPYSQTKRPNIEAIKAQTTYSYYDPSFQSGSSTHYFSPSTNSISVSSSKKPYSKPTTQITYSTAAPTIEIIKTTVGSKQPSTFSTSAGTKVNKIKTPTSASSRPSSSSSTTSTRPISTTQRIKVSSTQKQSTTSTKGTRKPPSTSYVYSPYPTKRPGASEKTSTSAKPTKKISQSQLVTAGTRLPGEFIVQSKPVTQARPTSSNSYFSVQDSVTSSRPNPTVYITPKPNVNLITSSNYGNNPGGSSTPGGTNKISTGNMPQGGISVIYNENPAVLIPAPADFDNEGYFGVSTTMRPISDQHLVTQTSIFTIGKRPSTIHVFAPTTPSSVLHYNDINDYKTGQTSMIPIKGVTHAATDDLINFPPVRNPNLNLTNGVPPGVHTGVNFSEEEDTAETTPVFVEDEVLHNKMDLLVSKIVASLQNNFDDLADMVYERRNVTILKDPSEDAATLKPSRRPTTRKPITTTKRAKVTTTKRPLKATSKKPATTKKPSSSKRPSTKRPTSKVTTKPTKRVTTSTETATLADDYYDEPIDDNETGAEEQLPSFGNARIQCGVRPQVKSGRIVGGKSARFGEWPWQVLVKESTWLGLFTKNKCGGVLINNNYVMTAAHCQPGFLASLVAVLGEHDISGELEAKRSITKNVKQIIVHRQYDPATFENDLALLQLESPVHYDTHIVPICLPPDSADFTGRKATITGWGRLKYNGGVPSVLQEVQVPVMENSVCQEMFNTAGHQKKILPSFLCAGYANGQRDSCEGDSGGPLVLQRSDGRFELVGTVSHGIKCAAPYLPGVYMRTTFYKPWIKSVAGIK